ncbi:olfactory receptor 13H1-like [Cynocephalus volans]|uniref:olfactory receptor 13H1-like n=1 Tax=Cynocephalus volans TaxID=110931 RepID=UPI002FC79F96
MDGSAPGSPGPASSFPRLGPHLHPISLLNSSLCSLRTKNGWHLQRCYLQPRAVKRVLERKGAEPARAAAPPVPARLSCREARPLCHPFPDPSPDALAYELHGDEKRLPSAPSTVAGAVRGRMRARGSFVHPLQPAVCGPRLWIDEMNYQEIGNHNKVTEFVLVGLSNHPTSQSVLFWALMFLYILTLAGNSMIVFLVGVSSQLHTPMYFFLGNSSLLDLLFSTSALPLIMAHSLQNSPTISYSSCFAQLAIRAFLALAECFLLAIMAYDRNVAISNPLRYTLVMSSRVCTLMALVVWVTAFLLTVVPILLFPISFCGQNAVNHFSCEVQAIFKLLCSNTISLEVMMMVCAVISMPVPLTFILISYLCILRAVLRIHPTEARLKDFSTCGSHLVVVTIYFGTLIYISMRPQAKKSQDGDCMGHALRYVV